MTLRPLTLVGIILSIVTGTSIGVLAYLQSSKPPPDSFGALEEALRHVSDSYVEAVTNEELLSHAIEGVMRGLDDHSTYLNKSALSNLEANTTGRFGGIGIQVGLFEGFFSVVSPMHGTPAERAGIEPGDRITAIDGESLKGKTLSDVADTLRGDPGSLVHLLIEREGEPEALPFSLEREVIELHSVTARLLDPGYGYLRITQFQSTTGDDVLKEFKKLSQQTPLQGLVIDLRNNPGGTLQSSVQVADAFLEEGLIVYTKGRLRSSNTKYRASRGDVLKGSPLVLLINGGSASASEIVAGALQDHARATLLGSKSFGKGSVQSVLPINEEQALKLTTAYYFTPNGRSIHHKGIQPDIAFDGDDDALLAKALGLLKGLEGLKENETVAENTDDARQARL